MDRRFGRYFFGKVGSSVGMWIHNITAAIVVWELTRSATLVGLISVAQFIAPVVLAPWTGALTDIVDRRRLLMVGTATAGVAGVLLAIGVFIGFLTTTLVMVSSALIGLGIAVTVPSMQALLPALVPPQDLGQAIALNAMVGNLARAVGPALGTGLLLLGGPGIAFGVAAMGHLFWAASLAGLLPPAPQRRAEGRAGVFDGFRFVGRSPRLRCLLLAVGLLGFGIDPVMTLTPALAEQVGHGKSDVGLLASSFGLGAVAVAFVQAHLHRHVSLEATAVLGFVATATGLGTIALGVDLVRLVAGLALAGAGFLVATTALTTQIHRLVAEELRGRVMAVWGMAFVAGRPIAAVVNGVVADMVGAQLAVGLGAAVAVAAALVANGNRTTGRDRVGVPRRNR